MPPRSPEAVERKKRKRLRAKTEAAENAARRADFVNALEPRAYDDLEATLLRVAAAPSTKGAPMAAWLAAGPETTTWTAKLLEALRLAAAADSDRAAA